MGYTVAVFEKPEAVECVSDGVKDLGIGHDHVSLIVRDPGKGEIKPEATLHPATASHAVKGGLVGGLAGLLVGVGTVMVPGVGPIIAAGPLAAGLSALAAALSGVAAGTVVGALTGLLIDLGVPKEEAKEYAGAIERGDALITVQHDAAHDIGSLLRHCGGRDIRVYAGRGHQDVSPGQPARGPHAG